MANGTRNDDRDNGFMGMALDLARLAYGKTSPNPMVGALIVKNGRVIGKGFHRKAGMPHAEVEAIREAQASQSASLKGAVLYVTLEPCCHQGRTPPCVEAILSSGIRDIVVGMKDPDEKVSGRGIRLLKKQGLRVRTGVLEAECQDLNEAYVKHRSRKMPYVTLKIASTLDGKIALAHGESQWITNEESRRMGHVLRDQNDAVLVGLGTIEKDDPRLTTRLSRQEGGKDPIRVVLDSGLRISTKAQVLRQLSESPTWIATTLGAQDRKVKDFEKKFSRVSFEILSCRSDKKGRVDLPDLLKQLASRGILSVLVEGGPTVATAFLKQRLVDRVVHFISPSYLGDGQVSALQPLSIRKLSQRLQLKEVEVRALGCDVMIEGLL